MPVRAPVWRQNVGPESVRAQGLQRQLRRRLQRVDKRCAQLQLTGLDGQWRQADVEQYHAKYVQCPPWCVRVGGRTGVQRCEW